VNNKLNGSNGIGSLKKSPSGEMLYSDRDKAVLYKTIISACLLLTMESYN